MSSKLESFIKKINPDRLNPKERNSTIKAMVNTLSGDFTKYDCHDAKYIDSQQILRNNIGVSSESGTSHGIYDDPSYYLRSQNTPDKKKITTVATPISVDKEISLNKSSIGIEFFSKNPYKTGFTQKQMESGLKLCSIRFPL